jgi:C4-dicarboxylate-specific signal transduction histidine kinase
VAQPLRRQIIVLNAAIALPVFAAIAWSARQTYFEQLQHLRGETQALASVIVVYLQRNPELAPAQSVIERIALPAGSVITITDDRGLVLARSRDRDRYVGKPVDHAAPARMVPSSQVLEGMDGVERVFGNVVYPDGPWLVSVGIPTAVAVARTEPIYARTVLLTVAATLFTLLVEFVIVRRYTTAFDKAIERSARVAAGDLSAQQPVPMPSLEMDRLQTSFIEMVRKLREARAALSAQVAEERHIREELELLQRQVIRQERLAAIGVLVSGVAHELNNPLQAILGFAELLQMRDDLPPQIRADLELIQKESARASGIIRNLSRFGRQQTSDSTPIRLRDVVASVLELRQRKLKESNIDFDVDDRAEQAVLAIFTELQQVVLNFVINAEQAVPRASMPHRIRIRTLDVGDRVRLEVQDSGPGVPREHEPKLFQPFFTTKSVGEGTGLGLSISYGIIQSHGGTIGYTPAPGGGAIFYFDLPSAPVAAASPHHS